MYILKLFYYSGVNELDEFICYEIESNEQKNKLDITPEELEYYLDPKKMLLIVREDVRRIFVWKGVMASAKKRFLGARMATRLQAELIEEGYHRCNIKTVDQGEEQEEFLNLFGLESMEIKEKPKDKFYVINSKKEEIEISNILEKKHELPKDEEMQMIEAKIGDEEKIMWIKNERIRLTKDWMKNKKKNEAFYPRVNEIVNNKELRDKEFKVKWLITTNSIISSGKFNTLLDYSDLPQHYFQIEENIAILDIEGLTSLDITREDGSYTILLKSEPDNEGIFLFEKLTLGEYQNCIDLFTRLFSFRAKIPEEAGVLTYIKKND